MPREEWRQSSRGVEAEQQRSGGRAAEEEERGAERQLDQRFALTRLRETISDQVWLIGRHHTDQAPNQCGDNCFPVITRTWKGGAQLFEALHGASASVVSPGEPAYVRTVDSTGALRAIWKGQECRGKKKTGEKIEKENVRHPELLVSRTCAGAGGGRRARMSGPSGEPGK
ncbi:unnamed protein product [Pleuronectes platessa]|uniref:Uncharacterized protein n=1 Tax=Pleuronectes platessa TaxID=8262 RepID=A0A9N7Y7U8_PLEPL|nr:unnamed protein product [Pleuronectes platessa]